MTHSHGGNVALYALAKAQLPLSGLVFLGTPFIDVAERRVGASVQLFTWGLVGGLSLVVLALLNVPMLLWFEHEGWLRGVDATGFSPGDVARIAAVFLLSVLLVILLIRWTQRWMGQLSKWLLRRQRAVTEDLRPQPLGPVPVLNLRAPRDEARWYLTRVVTGSASGIPNWLANPRWFFRVVLTLALLLPLGILPNLFEAFRAGRLTGFSEGVQVLFALVFFSGFGLVVLGLPLWGLLQCLVLVWPVLFRAHPFGFGEWKLSTYWMVDLAFSEAPNGATKLQDEEVPLKGSRRHSQLHSDPKTVARIAEWIAEQRASSASAP